MSTEEEIKQRNGEIMFGDTTTEITIKVKIGTNDKKFAKKEDALKESVVLSLLEFETKFNSENKIRIHIEKADG